jgi:short-subunit dehydrogenase
MKKAIIIGASSGIGKELAKILSHENYVLGLAARRDALLQELQKELGTETYIKHIDLSKPEEAISRLRELIAEMNGVDLIIIASGIGFINHALDWDKERETIEVNVLGVTAMINVSLKYFIEKGSGQLAVISSIAALLSQE